MTGDTELCCGNIYRMDYAGIFLESTWHPGGSNLTRRLASQIQACGKDLILDVACGVGATPRFLADQFGCRVVGMDVSQTNAVEAIRHTDGKSKIAFLAGDAHHIPVASQTFDAALLECSLSTFREKHSAVGEIARVLKPGGRLGVSDVVVEGDVPEELKSPLMNAFCIGDALSTDGYRRLLELKEFKVVSSENRKQETLDFLEEVKRKLFIAKMMAGIGKLKLESLDLDYAQRILSMAIKAAQEERLGYALIVASKGE